MCIIAMGNNDSLERLVSRYKYINKNRNKKFFHDIETEFESVSDAKKWIIRNQLARRNVPDFVRCELVLPLEEELKKEANLP